MRKKDNKQMKSIAVLILMLSVLLSAFFESHLAGASGLPEMQNETKEGIELQVRESLPEHPLLLYREVSFQNRPLGTKQEIKLETKLEKCVDTETETKSTEMKKSSASKKVTELIESISDITSAPEESVPLATTEIQEAEIRESLPSGVQETPEERTGEAAVDSIEFPLLYQDETAFITVFREQYGRAMVYAAHLVFSDYERFGMFTGASTVSEANSLLGAVLCVNGDVSSLCGYPRARGEAVLQDGGCYAEGLYSSHTGLFFYGGEKSKTGGTLLSQLVQEGRVTDTFQFGPAFLRDGQILIDQSDSRRPRTFMGTNGCPGDIWIVVANGDYNDGSSIGLTGYECAVYLQSKGCSFGIPLDGGGSSEMIFQGKIINTLAGGTERSGLMDFVYFR